MAFNRNLKLKTCNCKWHRVAKTRLFFDENFAKKVMNKQINIAYFRESIFASSPPLNKRGQASISLYNHFFH